MRGLITEASKVIDGTDQAAAKGVVPESVDHDAGRQRVLARADLGGEF